MAFSQATRASTRLSPYSNSVPYTLNASCTSNNTILTLSIDSKHSPAWNTSYASLESDAKPKTGRVIMRLSTGLLRYTGAQRGSYEAATQTSLLMFRLMAPLVWRPSLRRNAQSAEMLQLQEEDPSLRIDPSAKRESIKALLAERAVKRGADTFRFTKKPEQYIRKLADAPAVAELTVSFNGFGQGRDALYSAITSVEGKEVARTVKTLRDVTPLKIGGSRPRKRRVL